MPTFLFAQDFSLPKIEYNINSVQEAFGVLLENTAGMGFYEYDSSWIDNPAKHKRYLDSVLDNMTYERIKMYVENLNTAISKIDYGDISKRQHEEFEKFMSFGYGKGNFYDNFPKDLRDFKAWVSFFKNENTNIRDFLISNKNKENLFNMLNDIQQKFYNDYKIRLENFCTGWGL